MKIENQICTFDQVALIYSFGLRIENTLFQWSQNKKTGENLLFLTEINPINYDWVCVFPAYTVAELETMLISVGYCLRYEWETKEWILYQGDDPLTINAKNVAFPGNGAESRAYALYWLIQTERIKVKDLKL